MSGKDKTAETKPPITFVKTTGSPVTGRHKEKRERIRETISDLQLAIDGVAAQLAHSSGRFEQLQQTTAAFARACSIFLRKMVVEEDRNRRMVRLLDGKICTSIGLKFSRIKRISTHRRYLAVEWSLTGGYMQLEKLDEATRTPQSVHNVPIAPLQFSVSVEWPLPGTASWTNSPTREKPWKVRSGELFDAGASDLTCAEWMGQQLVMFDNRGICLKDVLKTIVTYEGAHSLNVSRLLRTADEKDTGPSRNPEVHILNNLTICGIKYNHIVVIESALYLYQMLIDNAEIERPKGEINLPTLCLLADEDIFASNRRFLGYDGGVIIAFGEKSRSISHEIRAVR